MPNKTSAKRDSLESTIRGYLEDLGYFHNKMKNDRLVFGFQFKFPKTKTPEGKELGRLFHVVQPKGEPLLEVSAGTQIDPRHFQSLQSLGKVEYFYREIQKACLMKDLFYLVDQKKNVYIIKDNIYFDKDQQVSIVQFTDSLRRVSTTVVYTLVILNDMTSLS